MKLYHQKMYCRTIHQQDVPHEPELIGQLGVFAKKVLPSGEILGMYTGFLLTKEQELPFIPDMHMILLHHDERNVPELERFTIIDGRGILSRINTTLDKDAKGQPIGVAKKALNVVHKNILIDIKMKNQRSASVFVPYYMTIKKIKKGAELRVDYGYKQNAFNKRFVKPYLQEHPEIVNTGASTSTSSSLKKGKKR